MPTVVDIVEGRGWNSKTKPLWATTSLLWLYWTCLILGTAYVTPEDLSIVWRPDTCIVPNFSHIESNINKQPSWYSARSSRHLAKCMHRIYSRRSYILNLFQNMERNSPVFAFCFTLDSWTILLFWQAQNLLQSMVKHYCADKRGKKWFIDSHPVHSNVKPSKEICFEHLWCTQNFLYSSYQKPPWTSKSFGSLLRCKDSRTIVTCLICISSTHYHCASLNIIVWSIW
jgi:hypothetical protein